MGIEKIDTESESRKKPPVEAKNRPDSTIDTVKIDIVQLLGNKLSEEDSNNRPDAPLEQDKLEIDNFVTARLTQKPHDKYKFRKSIGRGGMKMVLQVRDMDTTRDVAMAVLPDAAARPRKDILRFVQEARITASLEHPNIVPVHDIGVDAAGAPYFTMKLLRGETLASLLENLGNGVPEYKEAYDLTRLLRIFLKICHGIAFAHSKGVLHLDLKPENIQIGNFGEVLIMDWGLAKVIGKDVGEESGDKPDPMTETLAGEGTLNGIMKGTPGYMAPEQAVGNNSARDFRTDIYALGAILYAMATLKDPIENKNVKEMVRDTVMGNILPPKERTPDREIPSALEAVIRKAMDLNPENRYTSVKELRDEVYAFIGGYATVAEQATTLKKTLLFARRHSIILTSVGIVLFLLLGIGFYAMNETTRQQSLWTNFYRRNFTGKGAGAETGGLIFTDPLITKNVSPWPITEAGMQMVPGEWLWIDKRIPENTKLELSFLPNGDMDAVEVCLNSRFEPLQKWWFVPTGYSFQFGGYRGTRDMLFKSNDAFAPEIITAAESKIKPGKINKVTFIRRDERLMLLTENNSILQATDFFPPLGEDLDRIGIRTMGSNVTLCSISAYRLALPEKASPVIAGDALAEVQLFEKAFRKYLSVADSYANLPLADTALVKAYMTAVSRISDPVKKQEFIIAVKRRIAAKPDFKYTVQIREIDALALWKEQKFTDALTVAESLFKLDPDTNILSKLLQIPHQVLPEEAAVKFMNLCHKMKNLKRLDLSNMGLNSLEPLRGLRLTYLDCSGNALETLDGIEGMPLENLLCQNNRIESLEPLRGMPLNFLACQENRIESLEPLRKRPLRDLNCSGNRLTDLSPLAESPLERLVVKNNRISLLEPLRKLNLRKLDLGDNPVSDLTALRHMSLENLALDHTNVTDLSPLAGMPLVTVVLHGCKKLKDITPLFDMPLLERLSIPDGLENIEPLKRLPTLKFISTTPRSPADPRQNTVEDFWKQYRPATEGK